MAVVAAGKPAPDFTLRTGRGRGVHARAAARAHDGPRLLSVRVLAGLHGPAVALQRGPRGLRGARRDALRRLLRRDVLADGVPGLAGDRDRAALGLRAQGRGLPGVRRLSPGRLPAARARGHRSRRHRALELRGAVAQRSARREPDLRRARDLSDLGSAPLPPVGPSDHVRGSGRLVVVYGDYECPFCAAFEARLARLRGLLPPLPGEVVAPARVRRRLRGRGRGAAGRASGRCTTRCSPTRGGSRTRTCGRGREALGLDVARFDADRRSDAVVARGQGAVPRRRARGRRDDADGVRRGPDLPGPLAARVGLEVVALDHEEVARLAAGEQRDEEADGAAVVVVPLLAAGLVGDDGPVALREPPDDVAGLVDAPRQQILGRVRASRCPRSAERWRTAS